MGEEAKPEQAAAEAKREEKEEEKPGKEKKEEIKPTSLAVIYVDLHCAGCAKKIEKSIMKIRGVEEVVIDMAKNEVTVKGIMEPQAICHRIMNLTKRKARVISPLPAAEGEPTSEAVSSQGSGLTTVELNVNMHCEACAENLEKKILQMRGVQMATTELTSGKVTVTGTMNADKLVDYVYKRTRKQARIVPQPEPELEKKDENKEAEKQAEENVDKKEEVNLKPVVIEEGKKEDAYNENKEMDSKRMMYYYPAYTPFYVIERVPPLQLFSDENPNACCIS